MAVDQFFIQLKGPTLEIAMHLQFSHPRKEQIKIVNFVTSASNHNPLDALGTQMVKQVVTAETEGYMLQVMMTAVWRMKVSSTTTFGLGVRTCAHYLPHPTKRMSAVWFIPCLNPQNRQWRIESARSSKIMRSQLSRWSLWEEHRQNFFKVKLSTPVLSWQNLYLRNVQVWMMHGSMRPEPFERLSYRTPTKKTTLAQNNYLVIFWLRFWKTSITIQCMCFLFWRGVSQITSRKRCLGRWRKTEPQKGVWSFVMLYSVWMVITLRTRGTLARLRSLVMTVSWGYFYGGQRGGNSNGSYIVRTRDLLEDIVKHTGAEGVRFRQWLDADESLIACPCVFHLAVCVR